MLRLPLSSRSQTEGKSGHSSSPSATSSPSRTASTGSSRSSGTSLVMSASLALPAAAAADAEVAAGAHDRAEPVPLQLERVAEIASEPAGAREHGLREHEQKLPRSDEVDQ